MPAMRAASQLTRAIAIGNPSLPAASSAHFTASDSSSSRPVAPGEASPNGSSFSSSSSGVWSEQIASMVPSSTAARIASRSRWLRSGGVSRAFGSKKPMSLSVRCRWCAPTSQLTGRPSARAARTSAMPSADEMRQMCTRAPVVRISSKIVCSAMVSLITGTPDRPSRDASGPLCATPPLPRCGSCGRSHTV